MEQRDDTNASMLMRAVLTGETELVRLLVKWGAKLTRYLSLSLFLSSSSPSSSSFLLLLYLFSFHLIYFLDIF